MSINHTPLPFKVNKGTNGFTEVWIVEFVSQARTKTVAFCGAVKNRVFKGANEPANFQGEVENLENKADAEFIVRACNSHYELLDAVAGCVEVLRSIKRSGDSSLLLHELNKAEVALQNATK